MLRHKLWVLVVVLVVSAGAGCFAASADKTPSGLVVRQGVKMVKGPGARPLASKVILPLPFNDNCEGAFPGNWAPYNDPHFGPTTYKHASGSKSYYCAQSGTGAVAAPGPYPTNYQGWITYGPFSLAGKTSGKVSFKLWNNCQGPLDEVFAGWSLDDDFYEGATWTGNSSGWITAEVNMAEAGYDDTYLGNGAVYFSFYFKSDAGTTAEGAYVDDISITASSASGGVTGTVKTSTGVAIAGAEVSAGVASAFTDVDGKYLLKLAPGNYTITAKKTGQTFTPTSKSVTVASALVTVNFTGTSRGLAGTVKTSTGAVVKGAVVTAGSSFAYTDAAGKYSLGLAAGTYTVTARKPGYRLNPLSATVTVASTTVTKNFTAWKWVGDGVVRRWAVSVGIATFQYINNLNYCDDDARDVTAALKAGGFPAANIKQLIDAQATKAAIKSALAWMVSQADADDVCVFFQSSHGDQGPDVAPLDETGTGSNDEYLCPYDTSSARTTEIRDDELGQWLAPLKTTKYVVLIDSCYSGGFLRSAGAAPSAGFGGGFARALNGMAAPGEMNTKDLNDLGSGVVITASKDTELSEESGGLKNGVFAYYLVQGMNTGKADANKNTWYSAEEVFNYSKGPTHTYNPDQTLVIYDGYLGQLDFAKAKAVATSGVTLAVTGTAAMTKSGAAAIVLSLSAPANVSATILNLAGREVAVLGSQDLDRGTSTLLWSGRSKLGTKVPAGQYLVRVRAKDAAGNSTSCLLGLRQ